MGSEMGRKVLFAILTVIMVIGFPFCSSNNVNTEPSVEYMFYPPLPTKPRYQYLTTFSTSKDIEKTKGKLFRFIAGKDENRSEFIKKPYGVAIFEGVIYVCDLRSNALIVMDLKKRSFNYFGTKGAGKLKKPVNMDIDKDKRILYVTDTGRDQVILFDLNGRYIKAYGIKGQFNPTDVKVIKERLYVCDSKGNQIHVLNKNTGEPLFKIGASGHKEGELYHPSNISIYNNKIFVSDTTNFRVSIFDLEGKYLGKFGKIGRKPGQFVRPKGIEVDRNGRIYVVDSSFQNVQVFNDEFKLLLFMFSSGGEKHNINLPADIYIDYENIKYFKKYISPNFKAEYLLFVTSQFGNSKVNVYAFGEYDKKQ